MKAPINELTFFRDKKIIDAFEINHGLSHEIYRVKYDDEEVIVRANVSQIVTMEDIHLQAELANLDLTAKIYAIEPPHAIMEYLKGSQPTTDTWRKPALKTLAEKLNALHHFQPQREVSTLQLAEYIDDLLAQNSLNDKQRSKALTARHLIEQLEQWPQHIGLCHNDLNAHNIICNDGQIWLIDWENAAYCDIYFDLAGFIVEQRLNDDQLKILLTAYFSGNAKAGEDDFSLEKLTIMKITYCLICWLWYLVREKEQGCVYSQTAWFEKQLDCALCDFY